METVKKSSRSFAVPRTAVALGCLCPGKQDRYTCICCRVKFESVELQRCHFKTEWHLYNLKRKVCNLEPIDSDNFHQIQNEGQEKDSDETSTLFDTSSYVDLSVLSERGNSDDEEWEFLDEDYTDDDVEDLLARMIKSDTCLFCDCKSDDIKCNIDHMNMIHGFFLPEERYLIDIDGMMEYLGFKVGAGATCLWCNKQFTSLHGVRLHMLDKDHCKISYDQERASEYKDFYDYTDQEQIPMKPLDELVITRRKPRHFKYSASPQDRSVPMQHIRLSSSRNQVIKAGGSSSEGDLGNCKVIKRFDAGRARILLKTELSNNKTMRSRMRAQNPI